VGEDEFPKPNPSALKKLFSGIRTECPSIETLHIDNANPGVIARYPQECEEIAKTIMQYHTPGDVAAFGVESVDPTVIKMNNLKAQPDQVLQAIELINRVGAKRGSNGLPELLPGINFLYGLAGETRETYEMNLNFMKDVLNRGLLVRRINIRQVIPFSDTRMGRIGNKVIRKNKEVFRIYKERLRNEVDLPMLKRLVPIGTVLKRVRTEMHEGKSTLARQIGTYPLLVDVPDTIPLNAWFDFTIVSHGFRSVTGVPFPLNLNTASQRLIKSLPRISRKEVTDLLGKLPITSFDQLSKILSRETYEAVRDMIIV
jgi:radical SAM superfamily enzyme with C-terminal helix-hairpin-helix motif